MTIADPVTCAAPGARAEEDGDQAPQAPQEVRPRPGHLAPRPSHLQVPRPRPRHQEVGHCARHAARLALQTGQRRSAALEEAMVRPL